MVIGFWRPRRAASAGPVRRETEGDVLRELFERAFRSFTLYIPQTGTVGVLNSYYNGSMDRMIWGPDPR